MDEDHGSRLSHRLVQGSEDARKVAMHLEILRKWLVVHREIDVLVRGDILVPGKEGNDRIDLGVVLQPDDFFLATNPTVLESVAADALTHRQTTGDDPHKIPWFQSGHVFPYSEATIASAIRAACLIMGTL